MHWIRFIKKENQNLTEFFWESTKLINLKRYCGIPQYQTLCEMVKHTHTYTY